MGPDAESRSVPEEEEFNRDGGDGVFSAMRLWIAPVAEMNADARLLLLPVDAATAARLENLKLADAAVANENTSGDEKRIRGNSNDRRTIRNIWDAREERFVLSQFPFRP